MGLESWHYSQGCSPSRPQRSGKKMPHAVDTAVPAHQLPISRCIPVIMSGQQDSPHLDQMHPKPGAAALLDTLLHSHGQARPSSPTTAAPPPSSHPDAEAAQRGAPLSARSSGSSAVTAGLPPVPAPAAAQMVLPEPEAARLPGSPRGPRPLTASLHQHKVQHHGEPTEVEEELAKQGLGPLAGLQLGELNRLHGHPGVDCWELPHAHTHRWG